MIYTGLNNTGEVEAIYGHLNGVKSEISEVYGSIDYNNPIFYSRKTLTGTSPITFKALGQPLKDYHIFGETVQDGTPSPDYPVDVQGAGERTANLFDKSDILSGYEIQDGQIVLSPNWGISGYIPVEQGKYYTAINTGRAVLEFETIGGTYKRFPGSITSGEYTPSANTRYIRINFELTSLNSIILNAGTTALPYEPYGYKIPITIGNVTTPIYIGSERLYRIGNYADEIDFANQRLIRRIDPTTMQPYATPTTSTITAPQLTAEVGDNTLTVDTTVKPSAVSITGNIKPTGYGQLLDVNDVDIQDSTGEPIYIQG